jgi:eukaryotic-like serine/threonine-protein kinase
MLEAEVLSPGQALGRYELLAQVARGGMGQVWVARLKGARGFQKLVAIKTLLPELRNDARIEHMLLEEARIASLIQHSNVVQTTELGEHRGYLYLVMEWIDGESLGFVLKRAEERGAIPLPVAVNLVAQACRGLHAAHELTNDLGVHLGVVHRDVSPHNVLVTHSGVVKLVDFGIAKAMKEDTSFTENGEIKGKYSYMAPEQVLGEEVDRRADVFSLGITLYLMTTGLHPFKTGDKTNLIRAITSDAPAIRPSLHKADYPAALEAVLMKALAKVVTDRHASAEALRVALEAAVPEAFGSRFELQVKEYLAKVMGDRATARREALRRFQLAADERLLAELNTGDKSQLSSQSAGSLRAIMIDNALVEITPAEGPKTSPLVEPRPSDVPTRFGPRPRRRAPLFGALGAVALGVAALFAVRASKTTGVHATAAPALAPTLAAQTSAAAPAASERPSPSALPTPPAPTVTTDTATSASAESSSKLPDPALTPHGSKKSHHPSAKLDLIAPEYAK